jgi:hypothetical protein
MSSRDTGSDVPRSRAMVKSAKSGSGETPRSQPPRCCGRRRTVTWYSRGSACCPGGGAGCNIAPTVLNSCSRLACTSVMTAAAVTGLVTLAIRNSDVGPTLRLGSSVQL